MSQWQLSRLQCCIIAEIAVIILLIAGLKPLKSLIDVNLMIGSTGGHHNFNKDEVKRASSKDIGQVLPGQTWRRAFCHDFIVDTFHEAIPMCASEVRSRDQIKCQGNTYSNKMAACMLYNISLKPQKMVNSINLLLGDGMDCNSLSVKPLLGKTEHGEYQAKLISSLLKAERLLPSVCDTWINKTAFFHTSSAVHIYFRFLDLYNVYKALLDYGATQENYQVVRIENLGTNYLFPNFDKALFPGALSLMDLRLNGTVCFNRVILVPRCYQSIPFRCKMNRLLKSHCLKCDGRKLIHSPLRSFRSRVLAACEVSENTTRTHNYSKIVIVSRKPYARWSGDSSKNFGRVLANEDEMVFMIRKKFPSVEVKVARLEKMGICEQIRLAVEADVLLGVHGAGLVHFWWLRDEATAFELEPTFEKTNPTFRMLTTLTGRKYASLAVHGNKNYVRVDVDRLVKSLKKYLS